MVRFGGIQKTSAIDYPDRLCTTLFTIGCNWRCPFCYNPSLVLPEKTPTTLLEDELLTYLKSRKKYIDAVTISGGEPTIHHDLGSFLERLKGEGFSVKLDTNGSNPSALRSLVERGLVDYIAMDVKAPPTLEKYSSLVGKQLSSQELEDVKKSIELLIHDCPSFNVDYEFRTTAAPLLDERDIEEIASALKGAKRYALQRFEPRWALIDNNLKSLPQYSHSALTALRERIAQNFAICELRGF